MVLNKIPSFQEVKDWVNNDADVGVPGGVISMWSGAIVDIPSGWTLCDGTDGTPDLRDRFVAGAGGQYSAGATGGADSVQLSESEMPSHTHGLESQVGAYASSYAASGGSSDKSGTNDDASSVNTTSAGGDSAHENRPPFYALAFIMKV